MNPPTNLALAIRTATTSPQAGHGRGSAAAPAAREPWGTGVMRQAVKTTRVARRCGNSGQRRGDRCQGSGAGPRTDRLGEAIEHLRLRPGRRRGRPASGLRQAGTRLNGNAGRVAPVAGTRGSWGRRR